MRVAVPVWGTRISPVFDTARVLEIVDHERGTETSRHRLELRSETLGDRIDQLRGAGVRVLLCGAISRPLLNLLYAAGIEVHAFLAGECETLLAAWREGRLRESRFRMPGCCGGRHRRLRRTGSPQRTRGPRREDEGTEG